MTKPIATEAAVTESQLAQPARAGLFLVKPSTKTLTKLDQRVSPQATARQARSYGLLALAAAALAAPLLWWAHELLSKIHTR